MKNFNILGAMLGSTPTDLEVHSGVISSMKNSELASSRRIIPGGFMDLHCHGAAGYMTRELCFGAYKAISVYMAQHGVTGFLATFSAAPLTQIEGYIEFVREMMEVGLPGARLEGVYLEGPFLKNAGAMAPELLQKPTENELDRIIKKGKDVVKIMTVAPELPGAMAVIERLASNNIVPAAGHCSADAATLRKAVNRGLSHVTHLGNNSEGDIRCINGLYLHDGPLLEALCDDRLTVEVIMDGMHVDPHLVKIFHRSKGVNNFVAITDVCAAAGTGQQRLSFPNPVGELEKFEIRNGALYIAGTNRLTGSLLTMDKAFSNLKKFVGLNDSDAARSCGALPRQVAGIERRAEIKVGAKAEFSVLSGDGSVEMTVVDGRIVYEKDR